MSEPKRPVKGPPRLTRVQSAAATREQLLAAAGDLFAEVGFHAATVEAVVERAGYTRGAFYAHFTDKTDLFLTLLEQGRSSDLDEIQSLIAETDETATQAVVQTWFDDLASKNRWELAYSEMWPQASRDPALRARLAARQARIRAAIITMVERHCEAANLTLPIPASEVAVMMLALGDGIGNQRHLDDSVLPEDAFTKATMYLWAGLFAAHREDS